MKILSYFLCLGVFVTRIRHPNPSAFVFREFQVLERQNSTRARRQREVGETKRLEKKEKLVPRLPRCVIVGIIRIHESLLFEVCHKPDARNL
jgi:hypothetical protein